MEIPEELKIRGPPKRRWILYKRLVEHIFTVLFPNWDESSAAMAIEAGVSSSTLYDWKTQYDKDHQWRPYRTKRSQSKRLFTDEEERDLADHIAEAYIARGIYFTDEDFQRLATDAWLEKGGKGMPLFSRGFIAKFKKRNGFCSRRAHAKRRSSASELAIKRWRRTLKTMLNSKPNDRIVNIDETSWHAVPNNMRTWALKGSQSVQIRTSTDEKLAMTVLCGITAARTKLPMLIVAKGATDTVCKNLGEISPHRAAHSESGWVNEGVFTEYLMWLREYYGDDDKIYLVMDCYSVHRTERVKDLARTLNIEIMFVPPGATDNLQPLDRCIFGAMKGIARRKWRRMYDLGEKERMGKQDMTKILVASWEAVSPHLLEQAWNIYNPEDDEDEEQITENAENEEEDDEEEEDCDVEITEDQPYPQQNPEIE